MTENDCIFCKIIKGEIPSHKVFESESVLAFKDINPKAPVHILVIPKKHIKSLIEIKSEDKNLLADLLYSLTEVAGKLNLDDYGYKVVANNGKSAGQLVFHLHFHLLGGWEENPSGWLV